MSAMDGYAVFNKPIDNIYNVVDEIYAGNPVNRKIKKSSGTSIHW